MKFFIILNLIMVCLIEIYNCNLDLFTQQKFCGIVTNKHSKISHRKGRERIDNYLTLYFPAYSKTWVISVYDTNFVNININDGYCTKFAKGRITNPDGFSCLVALGFIYVALLIIYGTYLFIIQTDKLRQNS